MAQHGECRADCEKPEVKVEERYTSLGNGKVRYQNWLGKDSYKEDEDDPKSKTLWHTLKYVDVVINTSTIPNADLVLAQHAATKIDIDEDVPTEIDGADLYAEKPRKSAPRKSLDQMLVEEGQKLVAAGKSKDEIQAWLLAKLNLG